VTIGELLQLRQSHLKNRIMYVTESYVGFGNDAHLTMARPSLSVWSAVGFRMPNPPPMLEAING
jgi:hypothetical protein